MNTWPKCPRCKKHNVQIIEAWKGHTIVWDPGDAQDDGTLEPGDPYRVEGKCLDCGKEWRLRGVTQVQPEWWKEDKK